MTDTLTPEQRSHQMSRVRDRDTTPELVVRRFLHSCGLRYRLHVQSLPGCPDLVFPRLRKVVFVHGCFWHQHSCKRGNRVPKSHRAYWQRKLKANKTRDEKHRRDLRRLGWKVLTVWECQIGHTRLDKLKRQLDGKP